MVWSPGATATTDKRRYLHEAHLGKGSKQGVLVMQPAQQNAGALYAAISDRLATYASPMKLLKHQGVRVIAMTDDAGAVSFDRRGAACHPDDATGRRVRY